jgi:hypothetical protein
VKRQVVVVDVGIMEGERMNSSCRRRDSLWKGIIQRMECFGMEIAANKERRKERKLINEMENE